MKPAEPFKANQFMFVHEDMVQDTNLFLGPFETGEQETIVTFSEQDATWEAIAVALKIFASKGQARKNGWGGPLPTGLANRQKKKGKFIQKDIWVLNRINAKTETDKAD